MTGIERLRKIGTDYAEHSWSEAGKGRGILMLNIADQIERERACDADAIENIRLIVGRVIDDMERHVSGVECAEDSLVARWARELRDALGGEKHDPAADVSMSAYDLLPEEDRDAIAWVREHGGIESVKKLLDWVVGHCSTKQQLDFDFWLSGRVMHELGFEEDMADRDEVERRLLARLMPEGMEWLIEAWPRFEDGEPVRIGDEVSVTVHDEDGDFERSMTADSISFGEHGIIVCDPCHVVRLLSGERVKRPAPKVLDADGVEIKVGDTVWYRTGTAHGVVESVDANPILPIAVYRGDNGELYRDASEDLTHTKPEPRDSWERLEEDVGAIIDENLECTVSMQDYVDERRVKCPQGILYLGVVQDVLRRAKALAGVSE